MALMTTIDPAKVAVALGRPAPATDSLLAAQWRMWIEDALMLIQVRADATTPTPTVDQARLDYVIREAVVAQARRPDDATQVTTAVDDGSVSKTYSSSRGRVQITDDWWALLGLASSGGGVFAIDTVSASSVHVPWCSLAFGATYCSCGADIAGFPLYEMDGWP